MARANKEAPEPAAAPAPTPAPSPETIRVRGRAIFPPGMTADPNHRLMHRRAGIEWPGDAWVEHDVTLEQLAQLEADGALELRYEGKPEPPPHIEATEATEHERQIAELQARLRDAQMRAARATEESHRIAQAEIGRIRDLYDEKVRDLEARLAKATSGQPPNWFLDPPNLRGMPPTD